MFFIAPIKITDLFIVPYNFELVYNIPNAIQSVIASYSYNLA